LATAGVRTETVVAEQRALIIYQDALLRDLLQHLMRSVDGLVLVHACHVREFDPTLLREHEPTVVIADRMPAEAAVSLLEAIASARRTIRVVSVSLGRDELYVLEVSQHRPVGVEEFLNAVRGVETSNQRKTGEDLPADRPMQGGAR
jgi:DNA-binding NarL/FixJ family response regulator